MSDNTKISLMAILENIIIMICFTFLAWFFNHWWIVFGAIIFLNTKVRYNRKEDDKNG